MKKKALKQELITYLLLVAIVVYLKNIYSFFFSSRFSIVSQLGTQNMIFESIEDRGSFFKSTLSSLYGWNIDHATVFKSRELATVSVIFNKDNSDPGIHRPFSFRPIPCHNSFHHYC